MWGVNMSDSSGACVRNRARNIVQALGAALGRFVVVFNCDEKFDLQSMGRIFVGLCQVRSLARARARKLICARIT